MKKTMILMAACLVAGTAAAQDSPVDDWEQIGSSQPREVYRLSLVSQ